MIDKNENEETTLEVEYIDPDGRPIYIELFDGRKITIGKNVQDFYLKLLTLTVSERCQILKLNINELQNFIKEHTNFYNKKLISEFKKTWLWTIDSEIYDFSDKGTNEDLLGITLDKKQIIGKLKRNTFDAVTVFNMLKFFEKNDHLKEYYLEE